ncbi:MAG: hypothetical protein R3199_08615 [Gemmatimonadota bacterium]|nr:hypothetical protein [Gemmatimonadota bacterium]
MDRRPIRWRNPGSGTVVLLLTAIWVFVSAAALRLGPYPELAELTGGRFLEATFGWGPRLASDLLASLGSEGREVYLQYQVVDLLVAGFTALLLVTVVQWAVGRVAGSESEWHNLALLPLAALALELVENVSLFVLAFFHPSVPGLFVSLGSWATRGKLLVGTVAVLAVVAAVVVAWGRMWEERGEW